MITTEQWRAAIGCFSPRANKSLPAIPKIVLTPGKSASLCLRLLLVISLQLIVSGDVETNPGPSPTQLNNQYDGDDAPHKKRVLENSPNDDATNPKRLNQNSSPSDQSKGPDPPELISQISTANEIQPLYTPGRPVVFLSLDDGALTEDEVRVTTARRHLTLDVENDAGISTSPQPDMTSSVTTQEQQQPMWVQKLTAKVDRMESEVKKNNQRMSQLEEQLDKQTEELHHLRDQLLQQQTRSMRSNLIFTGIPETTRDENSERVVRDFIEQKLGVDTTNIEIERAHRLGGWKPRQTRPLVAKFLRFKEKEVIKQAAPKKLVNTKFGVNDQFPKEIKDKRRLLIPLMKDEKRKQKRANLIVDKLYTDEATYTVRGGKIQRENNIPKRNAQDHHRRYNEQHDPRTQHYRHDLRYKFNHTHNPLHNTRTVTENINQNSQRTTELRHTGNQVTRGQNNAPPLSYSTDQSVAATSSIPPYAMQNIPPVNYFPNTQNGFHIPPPNQSTASIQTLTYNQPRGVSQWPQQCETRSYYNPSS